MPISERLEVPAEFAHFAEMKEYEYFDLKDAAGRYAVAAVADMGEDMELHLEVIRWGPQSRRAMADDLEWLKAEARRRGKKRILGFKAEDGSTPDTRWPRFTRMYGFQGHNVIQTAYLDTQA